MESYEDEERGVEGVSEVEAEEGGFEDSFSA